MLLCFLGVSTTGLTHDLIYLYVLQMYPDFAESLKQYLWNLASFIHFIPEILLVISFYIYCDYLSRPGALLKKNVVCLVLSATVSTGTGILYILTHKRGLQCYESALNYFFFCVQKPPKDQQLLLLHCLSNWVRGSRRDCRIMKTFLPWLLFLDSHLWNVEPIHRETQVYWNNFWNYVFSFIEQLDKNLQENEFLFFCVFFSLLPPVMFFFSQMKQTKKKTNKTEKIWQLK